MGQRPSFPLLSLRKHTDIFSQRESPLARSLSETASTVVNHAGAPREEPTQKAGQSKTQAGHRTFDSAGREMPRPDLTMELL